MLRASKILKKKNPLAQDYIENLQRIDVRQTIKNRNRQS